MLVFYSEISLSVSPTSRTIFGKESLANRQRAAVNRPTLRGATGTSETRHAERIAASRGARHAINIKRQAIQIPRERRIRGQHFRRARRLHEKAGVAAEHVAAAIGIECIRGRLVARYAAHVLPCGLRPCAVIKDSARQERGQSRLAAALHKMRLGDDIIQQTGTEKIIANRNRCRILQYSRIFSRATRVIILPHDRHPRAGSANRRLLGIDQII